MNLAASRGRRQSPCSSWHEVSCASNDSVSRAKDLCRYSRNNRLPFAWPGFKLGTIGMLGGKFTTVIHSTFTRTSSCQNAPTNWQFGWILSSQFNGVIFRYRRVLNEWLDTTTGFNRSPVNLPHHCPLDRVVLLWLVGIELLVRLPPEMEKNFHDRACSCSSSRSSTWRGPKTVHPRYNNAVGR